MGILEERKMGVKSLFEDVIAKTIPNLGKENVHLDSRSPVKHIMIKLSNVKMKEFWKQQKENLIQESSYNTISGFVRRKIAGQKGVGWSNQGAKQTNKQNKIKKKNHANQKFVTRKSLKIKEK